MKVQQNGISVNIKVTSVILEANPNEPDLMHLFRCPNDGEIVGQYRGGDIVFIVPGETPAILPMLGYCRKCKARYLFNSIA